ncbi:hypothetical protein G7Y89_g8722 [Cudoniella acicularis]|uniref:Uncharacterized protein n=1 Tax=Cudoniella acicularis TaxID=354080 RepID=A0A8H4W0T1_9HELO|nr:hypothetical protein G7Y89_g8722 [Cudoniella acicularis]
MGSRYFKVIAPPANILIGPNNETKRQIKMPDFWKIPGVSVVFGGWGTTSELLEDILNDSSPDLPMVMKWKGQKSSELASLDSLYKMISVNP